MSEDQIEKLTILYIAIVERGTDKEDFEWAKQWFESSKNILNEKDWKDGKHFGDCTRHSTTCFRCLLERYQKEALNISNYLDGKQ